MKLVGKWKSLMYPDISGDFTLTCDDPTLNNPFCDQFTAELILVYSKTSKYKPGDSITLQLEGVYEFDTVRKIHRFVLRQSKFDVSQYFTLTLNSSNKKQWGGHLTCICPVDCVKLFNVSCEDGADKPKNEEIYDETITVTI